MRQGEEIEVTIDSFALEGKCIARPDGFVVFVSHVVPGDRALVRIEKVKRNFAEASPLKILIPSPHRTTPPCGYFGVCGGCKWQHVRYEAQLALKRQNVIDAFERIGGFRGVAVAPTLPSSEEYFYRNKIEFSFSPKVASHETLDSPGNLQAETFTLGFHQAERFDHVLDVDACLLQSQISNEILLAVKNFSRNKKLVAYDSEKYSGYLRYLVIREGRNTGDLMVNLVTFDDRPEIASELCAHLVENFPSMTTFVNTINRRRAQIASGEVERVYHGDGAITERLGRYRFRVSANSFFQTNTHQAERLFELVKELSEFKPEDILYDLYSGTGALSIYMSDSVKKVIGIELASSAVRDAEHNALLNGVTNCYFLQGDLKEKLTRDTRWIEEHGPPDVVLLDPPRSGLHPKAVHRIARLLAPCIVYVSCNPATQARDIRSLVADGYQIAHLQPADLFPHTSHVESVAKLVRDP